MVLAWGAQVAGHAVAGSLDLRQLFGVNFRSVERAGLFGAALKLFLFDGEDRTGLDLNVGNNTGPSALVDKSDVVRSGFRVGNFQAFIVIDRVIAIIVSLVAAPLILAGRRKLQ
jgi:hypothetical protein